MRAIVPASLRVLLPLRLNVMLALVLGLAVAACSAAAPAPAPPARPLDEPPAGPADAPEELQGRVPLRLVLPPGYELQRETGPSFEVFHIWRVPPPGIEHDTALGIFVGRPAATYCLPGTGDEVAAHFRHWQARWHHCGTTVRGVEVYEVHLPDVAREALHVFVIGADPAERTRLRAIAETLELGGG
jgi:hypothetical protein